MKDYDKMISRNIIDLNISLHKRKEKTTNHQRRYQDQNDHQFLPLDRLHRPA